MAKQRLAYSVNIREVEEKRDAKDPWKGMYIWEAEVEGWQFGGQIWLDDEGFIKSFGKVIVHLGTDYGEAIDIQDPKSPEEEIARGVVGELLNTHISVWTGEKRQSSRQSSSEEAQDLFGQQRLAAEGEDDVRDEQDDEWNDADKGTAVEDEAAEWADVLKDQGSPWEAMYHMTRNKESEDSYTEFSVDQAVDTEHEYAPIEKVDLVEDTRDTVLETVRDVVDDLDASDRTHITKISSNEALVIVPPAAASNVEKSLRSAGLLTRRKGRRIQVRIAAKRTSRQTEVKRNIYADDLIKVDKPQRQVWLRQTREIAFDAEGNPAKGCVGKVMEELGICKEDAKALCVAVYKAIAKKETRRAYLDPLRGVEEGDLFEFQGGDLPPELEDLMPFPEGRRIRIVRILGYDSSDTSGQSGEVETNLGPISGRAFGRALDLGFLRPLEDKSEFETEVASGDLKVQFDPAADEVTQMQDDLGMGNVKRRPDGEVEIESDPASVVETLGKMTDSGTKSISDPYRKGL